MKSTLLRLVTALFGLLSVAAAGAQSATLYVNRVVVTAPGDVSLGELVRVAGSVPLAARETLSSSFAVLGDRVLYVPVAAYALRLETAFGTDAIIVGSRSLLVPAGTPAESQTYLLDRLIDSLQGKGLLGETPVELSLAFAAPQGAAPQDGTPTVQVQRSSRGVTEVSFALTGSNGGTVTGRLSLPSAASTQDSPGSAVKSGAAVRVVFHKGPITIEMPGKALSSAVIGGAVGVLISDTQKRFTGQVLEGKAVEVDLP